MHKHLRPKDCVLLTAYAQTAARVLAARSDDRQLEKLGRLPIAYGRALRINTVQKAPKPKQQGGIGVTWGEQLGHNWDDDDAEDDDDTEA